MKRLLAEPLVHFLALGALLFAAFSFLSADNDAPRDDQIIVTTGRIEHLAAIFTATWQRPPTQRELDGLIEDYVREEVAYREGMALGLDRDDTVIRRRIRQKLDFVAEDLASLAQPTDEDLAAYLEANPDDFRTDPRISFRHVYFNPGARAGTLESDVHEAITQLNGDPDLDPAALGDRILLERAYADVSSSDVASVMGPSFAAAVSAMEPGVWQGPVESGYGVHAVIIDARSEGRTPELDEARAEVQREWLNERRVETIDRFYEQLLSRYQVVVQSPAPAGDDP